MRSSSASKPISSPGRTDKYPPPLMRFLRGNVGSKSSRGRSRATPLFTRRKKGGAIDAHQQEPSSPKVTCIGQVRVRRSSSSKSKPGPKNRDPPPPVRRRRSLSSASISGPGNWFCFWVGKPPARCCSFRFSLCCCRRRRRPGWLRKWASFFCCRSSRVPTDSPKKGSNLTGSVQIFSDSDSDSFAVRRHREGEYEEEEDEEDEHEFSGRVNGSDESKSTTPPKNALLLTRCRSAPHRSSYLATRFWGSPLKTGEEEDQKGKTGEQENRVIAASSEIELAAKSRIDGESEGNFEIRKEEATESDAVGTEEEGKEKQSKTEAERAVPVVLTRCKSEPGRSSGDPLTTGFWRERRLESTVSCRNSIQSK